jgi:hypothetical protein
MTGSGYRSVAGEPFRMNSPPPHPYDKRNHHFLMYDRKWLSQHCWWWLLVKAACWLVLGNNSDANNNNEQQHRRNDNQMVASVKSSNRCELWPKFASMYTGRHY